MKLIDADALREDLRRFFPVEVLEGIEPKTLFVQIMHDIDNAPTVEPEITEYDLHCAMTTGYKDGFEMAKAKFERPQGKWIFDKEFTEFGNPYGTYRCSVCGCHSSNKYSFCKDCGADMRGKE